MLPILLGCGAYGTYTHRYAWQASASFVGGEMATGLLCGALVLFVLGWVALYQRYDSLTIPARLQPATPDKESTTKTLENGSAMVVAARICRSSSSSRSSSATTPAASWRLRLLRGVSWLTIGLVNFAVVTGANFGFVYVSVYEARYLPQAEVALVVFKFGWNSVALRRLIKLALSFAYDVTDGKVARSILSFELLAALFNNVAIPCATVAMVDPNCFYAMLVAAPPVTASYTFPVCTKFIYSTFTTCIFSTPTIGHTSFAAPFTYSYQCSASFTTHYAPAFVNVAILTGFLVPALQLLLLILHSRQLDKLEACVDAPEERSALLASAWTRVLDSPLVGDLLRPVELRPPAADLADQQQQQTQLHLRQSQYLYHFVEFLPLR